jgi:MFS family permease
MPKQIHFAFMCAGHFFGHLFMLIFATAVALSLSQEWGMSYAELIPYATPGFIALGVCALPAGWFADKWSRNGMMILFFMGIGLSSIFVSYAETPLNLSIGLLAIGVFASIYHPVGISLVVQGRKATGVPLAVNGVFGNMGVASAALITGFLIDYTGWRSAFVWPGFASIVTGITYAGFLYVTRYSDTEKSVDDAKKKKTSDELFTHRRLIGRVFAIIFFSTAIGGLIFQSTTFALPKMFEERLAELDISATVLGWYAFIVFAFAATGQLIVGYLLDRYSVRAVFSLVAALQAVFFGVMLGLSGVSALVVAIAFMLAVFGQIPINDVLISRVTQSEWRSRAYAFRYIVTFSVSASSIPFIAWIHSQWGFDILFIILSTAAILIFVSVLMLPRALSIAR